MMARGRAMRNLALLGGLGAAAMMAMGRRKKGEEDSEAKESKGPQEYKDIKGMDVFDETGIKSRLKRNPETGDLYDPEGGSVRQPISGAPAAKAPASTPPAKAPASAAPVSRTMSRITDTGDETDRLARRYPSPVPRTNLMAASPSRVRLGEAEFKKGGKVKKMAAGGSASKRADGCAVKGKTRGRMI